jgi:hypothetical protein
MPKALVSLAHAPENAASFAASRSGESAGQDEARSGNAPDQRGHSVQSSGHRAIWNATITPQIARGDNTVPLKVCASRPEIRPREARTEIARMRNFLLFFLIVKIDMPGAPRWVDRDSAQPEPGPELCAPDSGMRMRARFPHKLTFLP